MKRPLGILIFLSFILCQSPLLGEESVINSDRVSFPMEIGYGSFRHPPLKNKSIFPEGMDYAAGLSFFVGSSTEFEIIGRYSKLEGTLVHDDLENLIIQTQQGGQASFNYYLTSFLFITVGYGMLKYDQSIKNNDLTTAQIDAIMDLYNLKSNSTLSNYVYGLGIEFPTIEKRFNFYVRGNYYDNTKNTTGYVVGALGLKMIL